jgi:hypothetical protein
LLQVLLLLLLLLQVLLLLLQVLLLLLQVLQAHRSILRQNRPHKTIQHHKLPVLSKGQQCCATGWHGM